MYTYDTEGIPHLLYVKGGNENRTGGPFEDVESHDYKTVHTVITKTNTIEIKLTKANVWIVEYTQQFTRQKLPTQIKIQDLPQKMYHIQ